MADLAAEALVDALTVTMDSVGAYAVDSAVVTVTATADNNHHV